MKECTLSITLKKDGDFAISINTENCPDKETFVKGIVRTVLGKVPQPFLTLLLENPSTKDIAVEELKLHAKKKNRGIIAPSQTIL